MKFEYERKFGIGHLFRKTGHKKVPKEMKCVLSEFPFYATQMIINEHQFTKCEISIILLFNKITAPKTFSNAIYLFILYLTLVLENS